MGRNTHLETLRRLTSFKCPPPPPPPKVNIPYKCLHDCKDKSDAVSPAWITRFEGKDATTTGFVHCDYPQREQFVLLPLLFRSESPQPCLKAKVCPSYHEAFYVSTFTATKEQVQPQSRLDKGEVEKSRHKRMNSLRNGAIRILVLCCLTVSHQQLALKI